MVQQVEEQNTDFALPSELPDDLASTLGLQSQQCQLRRFFARLIY